MTGADTPTTNRPSTPLLVEDVRALFLRTTGHAPTERDLERAARACGRDATQAGRAGR
jgi:hypothetical protein